MWKLGQTVQVQHPFAVAGRRLATGQQGTIIARLQDGLGGILWHVLWEADSTLTLLRETDPVEVVEE
jgi:hypothetical protein